MLNKKLQKLYELTKEIKTIAPNMELRDEWEDVFSCVNDMKTYLDDVVDDDGKIPEIYVVEIIFEAVGTENDLSKMYENLNNEYTEFMNDVNREEYKYDKKNKEHHCHFYGLWIGDVNECVRLTHHAEGLYENTKFEFVHVEVCVDGEWYGR